MEQKNQIQFLQCKIQFQNFELGQIYRIDKWLDDVWIVSDGERAVELDFKTVRQNFIPVIN